MIPAYYEMMFPILNFMKDGSQKTRSDIFEFVKNHYSLNNYEISLTISNGMPLYQSRAGWAITYLSSTKKLDDSNRLLERVNRGVYKITKFGLEVAEGSQIYEKWYCDTYGTENINLDIAKSPDENLQASIDDLNLSVKEELLSQIRQKSPRFFEWLVLELVSKMGYGVESSLTEKTADGGIDGIISEDVFGFSKIYIQAKKYDENNKITRPIIQSFIGALSDKQTKKGLFITTSSFTREAYEFAKNHQTYTIVLVDKDKLAELMMKYKVGIQVKEVKEIYQLDNDFFDIDI